jgi:predicted aspartyl protease
MAKSRPIKKDVILTGRGGRKSVRRSAHVDTGSYRCVVPRRDADRIEAVPIGLESTLLILGKKIAGEIALIHIQLPAGECAAVVEAFVPYDKKEHVPLIVGQSFLEATGATVSFEKGRPVLCPPK